MGGHVTDMLLQLSYYRSNSGTGQRNVPLQNIPELIGFDTPHY